jgi:ribokinase
VAASLAIAIRTSQRRAANSDAAQSFVRPCPVRSRSVPAADAKYSDVRHPATQTSSPARGSCAPTSAARSTARQRSRCPANCTAGLERTLMTPRQLDLLVVGDVNPDLVLQGGEIEPMFGQRERVVESGSLVLGGSASITAVGAARLGLRTGIVGAVGDDVFGRFMRQQLMLGGVHTGAVLTLDIPTGISVALSRTDDRAVLTFRGAMTAFDPVAVSNDMLANTRHVHVASPFLQPRLRDGLSALVARAHAVGASVSLDTGWDPDERWHSVSGAVQAVDILLPNAQEAAGLAGLATADAPASTESSTARAAASAADASAAVLAQRGPLVVVKLGVEGALAVTPDLVRVRAEACSVNSVDATGAGDSFDAAFLAAWLEDAELAHALAFACACGALSTRGLGGTGTQGTREEAHELLLMQSGRRP